MQVLYNFCSTILLQAKNFSTLHRLKVTQIQKYKKVKKHLPKNLTQAIGIKRLIEY